MRYRLAAVLLLVACSSPTESENPVPSNAAMEIVSGQAQAARVATTLPEPCTIRVTAPGGAQGSAIPVPGVVVNFVVTEGGGSVWAGSAITNAEGIAAERWTLGTTVGSQAMEARAVEPDGTPVVYETFTADAQPGPLATYNVEVPDWGAFVGEAIAIDSRFGTAQDVYGNVLGDIPFTMTVNGSGVTWDGTNLTADHEVLLAPEMWVDLDTGRRDINASGGITFSFLNDLRGFDMTINGAQVDTLFYTSLMLSTFWKHGYLTLTAVVGETTYELGQAVDHISRVGGLYSPPSDPTPNLTSASPRTFESTTNAGQLLTVVITPK